MKKYLFFIIFGLILSSACSTDRQNRDEASDSQFGPGETTLKVDLSLLGDSVYSRANVTVTVPSLFDTNYEPLSVVLKQEENGIFSATFPVEREITGCGIAILSEYDSPDGGNSEVDRLGVGFIDVRRDSVLTITAFPADKDGSVKFDFSDSKGFNNYPLSVSPENPVSTSIALLDMSTYVRGMGSGEPAFSKSDLSDPTLITMKLDSLFSVQRNYVMEDAGISDSTFPWLDNYLRMIFTTRWILNFKKNFRENYGITSDSIPSAVLKMIGKMDVPNALNFSHPELGPHDFLMAILDNVKEIRPIGDTPVKTWISSTQTALSPYIGEPSPLLLSMLATMSYYKQIENNEPLSENQIAEIKANMPDTGLAALLLQQNDKLVDALNITSVQDNLTDTDFNLKEYIDRQFPGKPVLVDMWNSWCGPCRMSQKLTESVITDPKNSEILFMTLCDESTTKDEWLNMTPKMPGYHVRINSASAEELAKRYSVSGIPTFLYFDRDHNLVFQRTGFTSVEDYINDLNTIKK